MKKALFVVVIVAMLAAIYTIWQQPTSDVSSDQAELDQALTYGGKDCGSSTSTKGENIDGMDRNCFEEAFNSCNPARITYTTTPPNNHPIKTTVYVDGNTEGKCHISVRVENQYSYPEMDDYSCYQLTNFKADNTHLEITECENGKTLVF